MAAPRVIHDFSGFPKALSDFDYPAPGDPVIAREVADVVKPSFVALDESSWVSTTEPGRSWPTCSRCRTSRSFSCRSTAASRSSITSTWGARLAPLRARGVFVLCSGNVVHNLRRIAWHRPDTAFDWGDRFDAAVRTVMTTRPADIPSVLEHPDYDLAVPTPEHFLPLAYLCGLCDAAGETATPFAEGGTMGSLTMTSYLLGGHAATAAPVPGAAVARQIEDVEAIRVDPEITNPAAPHRASAPPSRRRCRRVPHRAPGYSRRRHRPRLVRRRRRRRDESALRDHRPAHRIDELRGDLDARRSRLLDRVVVDLDDLRGQDRTPLGRPGAEPRDELRMDRVMRPLGPMAELVVGPGRPAPGCRRCPACRSLHARRRHDDGDRSRRWRAGGIGCSTK